MVLMAEHGRRTSTEGMDPGSVGSRERALFERAMAIDIAAGVRKRCEEHVKVGGRGAMFNLGELMVLADAFADAEREVGLLRSIVRTVGSSEALFVASEDGRGLMAADPSIEAATGVILSVDQADLWERVVGSNA